ncbi:DEAD/DEAH box helicase family protein [Spiroplasma floricola]|uniref:Type III restriction enzyme, res subunit n=1 Tax=Spiroplasma floricola 23-6 TaxID=1336749 RepID=A0A2K8SEW7_9MOLU|nr:DEAD/DEAH box helicase family protein [Spiroplasma floricola]AUB31798.1 type III restriction enzyme, res subunit [Spiroplasma floricola 23-6]
MEKFKKGIYDLLIKENELQFFQKDDIRELENVDDDWLINQFSRQIKDKLSNFQTIEDKIKFLNNLTNEEQWTSLKAIKKDVKYNSLDQISINKLIKNKLWSNLKKEFESSNDIQMISPFISKHMINKLEDILVNNPNIESLKIITTTYDGTSKFLALEDLIKLANEYNKIIQVKIENLFEKSAKRLHIKSYLFNRENNFSSLYIGSSNFTKTGLITGNEHNLRISEFKDKKIIEDYREEFDQLFNSTDFIDIKDHEQIQNILLRQKIENDKWEEINNSIWEDEDNRSKHFERINAKNKFITPYSYQKEVVDNILNRVNNGKNKHLLVMATGTGKTKTMIFTYEALANLWEIEEPSLLYIAPSKEILDQTVKDFRDYLEIYDFGLEFYDSRNNDADLSKENWIFTNTETLIRRKEKLRNKKFDIVVFDEAHHVQADTFKEIYSLVLPNTKQVFGLTATPERTDNINVNIFFDDEYAANIRLFEAIEKELLCDFDYFFIKDDSTDLTNIDILKTDKLNKVLNIKKRHEFVYKNIQKYIGTNSRNVKAILFCNSIEHARDLSNFLNEKGERSEFLVSEKITKEKRKEILNDFRRGKINFLCVRDILNEGVDVPEIDTIMFLRPTASVLIYLQQLGRGMRKVTDKRLQIYDFVNNVDIKVNKNYNPLTAFNVLTNDLKINEFEKNINHINDFLPGDSNFILTKIIKEDFLNQLKEYEKHNLYKSIIDEYRTGVFEDYESFFRDKEVSIYEFYNLKKAYFRENLTTNNQTRIRQFMFFNNKNLIKEILEIIENKKISNNKLINKIFLVSFHHSPTKQDNFYYDLNLAFETIFNIENKFFLKEIKYLLKFKLNNEKLLTTSLTEEIESFKGLHLNHNQFQALCSITVKDNQFKGKGVGGIISNKEDKIFAIDASTNTISTKFGHGNIYDYENQTLYWDTPDDWKFDMDKITEMQRNMMNLKEYKTYVFFSDEKLRNEKGDKAKVFIGKIEKIIDRKEVENGSEKKSHKKPKFIFKIS